MFTGLVESTGEVLLFEQREGAARLVVGAPGIAGRLREGDSVSVSGVCLTALGIEAERGRQLFAADLAEETIARTTLSRLKAGAVVNLELPTQAGAPLGGHVVQGHVDGVGRVTSFEPVAGGNDYVLAIAVPSELTRYIVAKGSLTIEGISLTVAAIDGIQVRVAIIPHTAEVTNLRSLKAGDAVNLEVDVIAKYVEKMFGTPRAGSSITVEKLVRAGF